MPVIREARILGRDLRPDDRIVIRTESRGPLTAVSVLRAAPMLHADSEETVFGIWFVHPDGRVGTTYIEHGGLSVSLVVEEEA